MIDEYRLRAKATALLRDDPDAINARRIAHITAAAAATTAGRAELIRLHREGQIHSSVLAILEEEFDLEELRLRRLGSLAAGAPLPRRPPWRRRGRGSATAAVTASR